jgi:cytochrome c551/c552
MAQRFPIQLSGKINIATEMKFFNIKVSEIISTPWCILILFFVLGLNTSSAQHVVPTEDDYYKIITLPVPEGILLEVGGVATMPDGRIAICTRRGDVWLIENPTAENSNPEFTLFASGLHEALGLLWHNGALYTAQRGELTRLVDRNGDDRADLYETVYAWPVSGHYHEYSYGPKLAPDGNFFVSGNVAFGDQEWWRGESRVKWRGWIFKIHPEGTLEPWATGMRSPCGLGMVDGELFYTDNQGDWMGSGGLWHVQKGDFTGHPAGLRWTGLPESPVKLTTEQLYQRVNPRKEKKDGLYIKPSNIEDEKDPDYLYEVKKDIPQIKLPAVWLPHGVLGISNSEIITDQTHGAFGPFAGQLFIGDQGQSKIMRVALEKVKGQYQGVAIDFRQGFQSGVLRMNWGHDGSMYVGETNRGWGSAGPQTAGIQRLKWTGKTPMEILTVHSMPDGFEIVFTQPVDKILAEDLSAYGGRSYIYKYHPVYGSPVVDEQNLIIRGVKVSADRTRVRMVVDNLRTSYLHELNLSGIRAEDGTPLLHPMAYYTLNNIADGEKIPVSELSIKRTVVPAVKKSPASKSSGTKISYAEIEPLLVKNTCTACHQVSKRQVGPAFSDIAKRNYPVEKIMELIYNPQPKNWPEYATPMAPMPQVPKDEARKIATWITGLNGSKP